ncbi:MAG: hypothetical protein ACR2JC_20470 [Chloroflexota bacterium]
MNGAQVTRAGSVRLITATAVLVLAGAARVWPLTGVRSGFAQAAAYLTREDRGAFVANEVMVFYLRDQRRGCDAPRLPAHIFTLGTDAGVNSDYAVIDHYGSATARYLERHARVVAQYPTIIGALAGENLIASENGVPPLSQATGHVDVYALDSLRFPASVSGSPPTCSVERLA